MHNLLARLLHSNAVMQLVAHEDPHSAISEGFTVFPSTTLCYAIMRYQQGYVCGHSSWVRDTAYGRRESCTSTLTGDYVFVLARKPESFFEQNNTGTLPNVIIAIGMWRSRVGQLWSTAFWLPIEDVPRGLKDCLSLSKSYFKHFTCVSLPNPSSQTLYSFDGMVSLAGAHRVKDVADARFNLP